MTLQGRLQDYSLPHYSKVKSHLSSVELDINASQACNPMAFKICYKTNIFQTAKKCFKMFFLTLQAMSVTLTFSRNLQFLAPA